MTEEATPTTPEQPAAEVEVLEPGSPGAELAARVDAEAAAMPAQSRNYMQAVELGHVLARSGYFTDARDPAKAAVKVMIGMDLGLSPTASLRAIHAFEQDGNMQFIIEGKLLGALIKSRPGYDYQVVERTAEKCTLRFFRDGEPVDDPDGPDVTYTIEDAKKAGLTNKRNWQRHPREMLTWRCLAEGQRLHFPEIGAGMPLYAAEEFGEDGASLREALEGPPQAQPLTDERAEAARTKAKDAFDQLRELNPGLLTPGQFNKLNRDAGHSHAELDNLVAHVEDLRDVEAEIQATTKALAEHDDKAAAKASAEAARIMNQRERLALLKSRLAEFEEAKPEPEPASA